MNDLKFEKFIKALDKFAAAVSLNDNDDLKRDGTIQRFEFTFELTWKMLKDLYAEEGVQLNSPKEVFKHAYGAGLIENESVWLNMLHDRNLTSHTYNEDLSVDIAQKLPSYCDEFLKLKSKIKKEE